MSPSPRDYDREFVTSFASRARRRIGYSHDRGEVVRFVVQLEYHHDGAWWEVVRFDHDPRSPTGHDVTQAGVHMDIYRNGEKERIEQIAPPMQAAPALTLAEAHLNEYGKHYIERYETWHGIPDR